MKCNCAEIKDKFPDFLTGETDSTTYKEIQGHISVCSACREELSNLSAIWTKLGVIPEEQPSSTLRDRFYGMLEAYKQGLERETKAPRFRQVFSSWLVRFWPKQPAFQFGLAVLFLVLGMAGGYFINTSNRTGSELARLHQEVQQMRQTVAVSLMSQASASDRLRGVNWTTQLQSPDNDTLDKLLYTLNNDPNVNVRLAAVDALYLFHDYPEVKDGIIQSLTRQDSPLVQVALIDLMVESRERRAAEALRQLIQDEMLSPEVKQRAEAGLRQIT